MFTNIIWISHPYSQYPKLLCPSQTYSEPRRSLLLRTLYLQQNFILKDFHLPTLPWPSSLFSKFPICVPDAFLLPKYLLQCQQLLQPLLLPSAIWLSRGKCVKEYLRQVVMYSLFISPNLVQTEHCDLVLSFVKPPLLLHSLLVYFAVKAQVRDLRYISGNLHSNYIIRHMLMKWTDYQPGICRWGVRIVWKELGIMKCVLSGLASCMFTIRCISIMFSCSLFTCYHWMSLEPAYVSQSECDSLHLSWTLLYILDCRCLHWQAGSWLGNSWQHSVIYWPSRNSQLPQDLRIHYQMELTI